MSRSIRLSLLIAVLLVAFETRASAGPYYVRSIATAQTSGNILNGLTFTNDTGQEQTTSNSAGPFAAHSGGQFYNFDAAAHVLTEIGSVHASVSTQALSTGPAGGANASAQGQWNDTITITSDSLPNGTLVSFLATIVLHRTITGAPPASASASVTGPFGLNLADSLSSPNTAPSVSTIVQTTVGSVLSATSTLSLQAGASGIAPFNLSAAVMAENTATFQFQPITPGASYSTASGVVFVPEPTSAHLVLCGLVSICLFGLRKIKVRCQ